MTSVRRDNPAVDAKAPVAVVMNMFYTGLGIARSLGSRGIRVIGLSSQRGIYGNFTRHAAIRYCPDSRENPDQLLPFLRQLGEEIVSPSIIFPTRDDDVVFLDRFRTELSPWFIPVVPARDSLRASLNKWETYVSAQKAGVPVPCCWHIESSEDLDASAGEVRFPCVLKPVSSHYWRKAGKWERVGARKAISVSNPSELRPAYDEVAEADGRVLLQEMIPGGDDELFIAAVYMNRESQAAASFTAQKLVQVPELFGTGCIVRTVCQPDVVESAVRLLREMGYRGVAEVEFKRDRSSGEYKLIEVNARPWDQHRLGYACGVDLIYAAYCDFAGLPLPRMQQDSAEYKWVAEDVWFFAVLRSLWRGDGKFRTLWRLAVGKRIYAIWAASDPLPFFAYVPKRFLAGIAGWLWSRVNALFGRVEPDKCVVQEKGVS